jgi:hypothetical protein
MSIPGFAGKIPLFDLSIGDIRIESLDAERMSA